MVESPFWSAFWFFLGGIGTGFFLATVYYRQVRLIRTKHEWYRDPVIRARYPEEAERVLRGEERDEW